MRGRGGRDSGEVCGCGLARQVPVAARWVVVVVYSGGVAEERRGQREWTCTGVMQVKGGSDNAVEGKATQEEAAGEGIGCGMGQRVTLKVVSRRVREPCAAARTQPRQGARDTKR